jgi:hypothetical protein
MCLHPGSALKMDVFASSHGQVLPADHLPADLAHDTYAAACICRLLADQLMSPTRELHSFDHCIYAASSGASNQVILAHDCSVDCIQQVQNRHCHAVARNF